MPMVDCPGTGADDRRAYPHAVVRAGLTKAEAEDLLDWLEASGRGPAALWPHRDGWAVGYGPAPDDGPTPRPC